MRIKLGSHSHYEDQGTDIYVKKIDQGAGYGAGYIVEIYDYGQKVDEQKVTTKKQVRDIINQQKAKYITDRAFEEESHLFVSYRIDDVESKKFRDQHELKVKESSMNTDEKLYKQASRINFLLASSKNPEVPLKFFKKADAMFDFNGESAESPIDTAPAEQPQKDSVEDTAQQISEKIDAYLVAHQDPQKDNAFNLKEVLGNYLKETLPPLLTASGYTSEEVAQVRQILVNRYKNSDIPNANIFFESRTASIISNDILGTSSSTNQFTNTTPQTGEQINSEQDMSFEAKNLIDKVNTVKDNPFDTYKVIKEFPNSENIIQEIQKKENKTEPESMIAEYKVAYANALYQFAGEELSRFYNEVKVKKGSVSFNKSFSGWMELKEYTPMQKFVINMRKASFIETATYQLQNKGKLPEDFNYKQAGERLVVKYLVKLGAFEEGGEGVEVSDKMVGLLKNVFYSSIKNFDPPQSQQEAEQDADLILRQTPLENYMAAVSEVYGYYAEEILRPYFTTAWAQTRQKINPNLSSHVSLLEEFWNVMKQENKQAILSNSIHPYLLNIVETTKEDVKRLYPQFAMVYDYLAYLVSDTFSASLRSIDVLEQGWAEGKTLASMKWIKEDKPINRRTSTLIDPGKTKHAVNIIINESADGKNDTVEVQESNGQSSTFTDPLAANTTLPETPLNNSTPNLENFGDTSVVNNAPAMETSALPEEPSTQSLFDELDI